MVVIHNNPLQLDKCFKRNKSSSELSSKPVSKEKLDQNTSKKAAEVITGGMLEDKSQSSQNYSDKKKNKKTS